VTALEVLCRSPLCWALRDAARALGQHPGLPPVAVIDAALAPRAGVRFRPAAPKPRRSKGEAAPRGYDAVITLDGAVPTREDNLHDLMNALVWSVFPRSKRALHARQHALLERAGPVRSGESRRRSAEGDALAMLDEGGLVVVARRDAVAEVEARGRARDATAVATFVAAGDARAVAFGHALYEHVAGLSPATPLGMVVVMAFDDDPAAVPLPAVDDRLAGLVTDPSCFLHNGGFGSIPFSSSVWGSDR